MFVFFHYFSFQQSYKTKEKSKIVQQAHFILSTLNQSFITPLWIKLIHYDLYVGLFLFSFSTTKIPLISIALLQIYPEHILRFTISNEWRTYTFSLSFYLIYSYFHPPLTVQKWLRQEIYTTWIKSE